MDKSESGKLNHLWDEYRWQPTLTASSHMRNLIIYHRIVMM